MLPGRQLLLHYPDDRTIWHAARAVYPGRSKRWYILTPDGDIYDEDVACITGQGPNKAALCSRSGAAPPDIGGRQYLFSEDPSDEVMKAQIESLRESNPKMEVPKHWVNSVGTKLLLEDVREVSPRRRLSTKRVDFALTPEVADKANKWHVENPALTGGSWMTMETSGSLQKYTLVEPKRSDVVRGRRGLYDTGGGTWVAIAYLSEVEKESMEEREQSLDNRILEPVVYDERGVRHLDFSTAVRRMTAEPMADFPLKNGRSLQWLLQYVVDHGATFDGRQTKWATEQKIDAESAPYVFHDLLGYALELGATFDQLDMLNCASMELIGRVYQMIEETRGSMSSDTIDHYIGRDATAGLRRGVALAPSLAEDATNRQSKETEILKQRRKAREEKALASGKGAKSGGK